jgi:hypothetical protein
MCPPKTFMKSFRPFRTLDRDEDSIFRVAKKRGRKTGKTRPGKDALCLNPCFQEILSIPV